MFYYKLTEGQIAHLCDIKVLPIQSRDLIYLFAKERVPGKFAGRCHSFALNKAKTIFIQNVHFYGGEHFGKPYYFLAEIFHRTTTQAFSAWVNKNQLQWLYNRIPFSY